MRNKKSLLGKKCENAHTPNALSRKIAPVLNIFPCKKYLLICPVYFTFIGVVVAVHSVESPLFLTI